MALRPFLPACALGLLAVCASAAPEPPTTPASRFGVTALDIDLQLTEARLDQLVKLAKMRPQELEIWAYSRYSEDAMRDAKKDVRARRLWDIVEDKKKDLADAPDVRTRAAAVLAESTTAHDFDPDLATEGVGGKKSPRAELCLKITPSLNNNRDPLVRVLANKVLSGLFPQGGQDPDIQMYNPDDRKTWLEATKSWERFLKRR